MASKAWVEWSWRAARCASVCVFGLGCAPRVEIASGAGGASADASGKAGAGASANGGLSSTGGAAGRGGTNPVDPQLSRNYRWHACGAIPPSQLNAVQTLFQPNSDALVVLYDDGSVLSYPNRSRAASQLLRPAGTPLRAIAFSPDGTELAEMGDGSVNLRRLADGVAAPGWTDSAGCMGDALRYAVEGDYLLTWNQSSLCVWRTESGALVRQIDGNFSSAALNSGHLLTAEAGFPQVVTSRPLDGVGTPIPLEYPPNTWVEPPQPIEISPRGDTLLSIGSDGSLLRWSADGHLLAENPSPFYRPLAYSASGEYALWGDQVIEAATGSPRLDLPNSLSCEHYTVDSSGKRVACVVTTGENTFFDRNAMPTDPETPQVDPTAAEVYDAEGASVLGAIPSASHASNDLAVSSDGTLLAVANNGDLLWRLAPDFADSQLVYAQGDFAALDVEFSDSGQELLFSGDPWSLLDPRSGELLDGAAPLPGVPESGFSPLHLSPLGTWLARADLGTPASVSILARKGLDLVATLTTARWNARGTFSPDETLLATTAPELYRTSDWSRVWPTEVIPESLGAESPVNAFQDVKFAPHGQTLLISKCSFPAELECAYSLTSLATGALIRTLPELSARRANFSSEGHWVVSGNRLLHLPSNELQDFEPNAKLSTFSPNGDIIAILNDNTLARYCRTP